MPTINGKKINNVQLMLRQYFNNNDPVTRDFLYSKVKAEIILEAEKAGYISCRYPDERYRIQQIGKVYRDKKQQ